MLSILDIVSKPLNPKTKQPTELQANTLHIQWDNPAILSGTTTANMKFKITYCELDNGNEKHCKIAEVSGRLSYTLRNLSASTTYRIKIQASHHKSGYGKALEFEATTQAGKL